jgi:glycosyltransferase involved in cell wall biosynthesis
MSIAIVIPAYNEAGTIADVVRSVLPHGRPIVVDDCSSDATAEFAGEAGALVVRHARNCGYDAALQSGFKTAADVGAHVAVTFDADGQHDANCLTALLAPLREGTADIVLGIRPVLPRFGERAFGLYTRIRYGIPDILCGLKAYRMEWYHQHGRFDGTRSIGTELVLASLAAGARVRGLPVHIHARHDRPRFGSRFRANQRVLRALAIAIWTDLRRPAPR